MEAAGDGFLHGETIKSAEKAGIRDRIVFAGTVDNIPAWMSAADVLLMPSLFEGMPFVLIEAQASGLPCVVSTAITRDADLTGLIRFLDLDNPPEEWAQELIACARQERKDYTEEITSAGYSIRHTAEKVRKIIENGGTIRN